MGRHAVNAPVELYACLYAREFPAQASLRLRPELRDKPVVIVEGDPPMQAVCSFNATAHKLGIARGMTRVELDTFPPLVILRRSQSEEIGARAALLECAGNFSPRIEERSSNSAFICVVDIAGTEKLFGPPETLAQDLLRRVRALGIKASVGISGNFHAALSYVRGSSLRIGIIMSGDEAKALSRLALVVLDLSSDRAETFALWGIRTLGALAALPEEELIGRMGQDGKRLRQLATGKLPHHFVPMEEPFRLEENMELDTPVEQLESLLFVLGVMLKQLILRAASRVLALASVTVTLSLERNATHTRTVRPALPSNDRQLWIKLLHLDLEAQSPMAAILTVTLVAEPGITSKVQLGLFSPQLPEPARLDITLARIRALVGESGVGRPVLQDTHRSDSFRMEPFTVPSGPSLTHQHAHGPAAMRRLRPPERVPVTQHEERLTSFTFRGTKYEVKQLYGPWLDVGEWWCPDLWALEQWDLIARSGEGTTLCCCLTRDLTQKTWQVVAFYD